MFDRQDNNCLTDVFPVRWVGGATAVEELLDKLNALPVGARPFERFERFDEAALTTNT